MSQRFKVVIPARYASTRLPGKPLVNIIDKPMIEWVYRAAADSAAEEVIVATDDDRVLQTVKAFGGEACLTRSDHATGTDRIVEVAEQMQWPDDTIIVNLQGDEPLMPAQNLTQVAHNLIASGCDMATLHKLLGAEHAVDPNVVKLVADANGCALYFSRSKIPFPRDEIETDYCGHIGLYAYRVGFLKTYASLAPCALEHSEKLEQLRVLFYGYSIHTELAQQMPGIGVDTEQDLQLVTEQLRRLT
jgi:3-deoxy-manno-octulosonate cytidylyltransferase (CMP-KDO synthetase)